MSGQSRAMSRFNGVLGMFIGLFGAMAILGVFFKIAHYPGWEIMMAVGFIGEAAAFVVMGIFALIAGFRGGTDYRAVAERQNAPPSAVAAYDPEEFQKELREVVQAFGRDLRGRIDDVVAADFSATVNAVGEQTRATCDEMRSLGESLAGARGAVDAMRDTLGQAAAGHLADDAARLGHGMRAVAEGMEEAGAAVETMRRDVTLMAERFRAFNSAAMVTNGQTETHERRV